MLTKNQNMRRFSQKFLTFNIKLQGKPQKLAVVSKVRIVTPRKPNSARRQAIKGYLFSTKFFQQIELLAYIHGSGHNLRKHSNVLIRGGGARDLPNVRYSCIRGKLDLLGLLKKTRRRSIYGASKINRQKLRRKFRFF